MSKLSIFTEIPSNMMTREEGELWMTAESTAVALKGNNNDDEFVPFLKTRSFAEIVSVFNITPVARYRKHEGQKRPQDLFAIADIEQAVTAAYLCHRAIVAATVARLKQQIAG